MNIRCTIWFVVISVIFIRTASGQAFVNLDFESATLVPVPGDRYHTVQFAQAFPGWTKTMIGAIDTNALYDTMFLDSAGIGIIDTKPSYLSEAVIGGNYTALLQSGLGYEGTSDATLSQTGLVPLGTESIQFKARAGFDASGRFAVILGGQTLPVTVLGSGTNYTLYGANVSQWAGQVAQLSFTVFAEIPHVNDETLLLDNIQFSTQSVTIAPPAGLSASMSGGNMEISWTPSGGTLESTSGLFPNGSWSTVGTQNPTNLPISPGAKFFRVRP
jgi:hypothetical protein